VTKVTAKFLWYAKTILRDTIARTPVTDDLFIGLVAVLVPPPNKKRTIRNTSSSALKDSHVSDDEETSAPIDDESFPKRLRVVDRLAFIAHLMVDPRAVDIRGEQNQALGVSAPVIMSGNSVKDNKIGFLQRLLDVGNSLKLEGLMINPLIEDNPNAWPTAVDMTMLRRFPQLWSR
jgi:hypothetical protein